MWLAIEGLIGAGKTTTAELLAASTPLTGVIERIEDHPFLESFYSDPRRYALETELTFVLLQRHQLRQLGPEPDRVSDFAPAKNLVFAEGSCSADELAMLRRFEADLHFELLEPDLTVFLDVPSRVCLERIATRGRPYEQGLTRADLEQLHGRYAESLGKLGKEVERLSLSGEESAEAVAEEVAGIAGLRSG